MAGKIHSHKPGKYEDALQGLLLSMINEQQHTNVLLQRLLCRVELCCRAAEQLVELAGAGLQQAQSIARFILLQIQIQEHRQLRDYLGMVKDQTNVIMLASLLTASTRSLLSGSLPSFQPCEPCNPSTHRWHSLQALGHALGVLKPSIQASGVHRAWRMATCYVMAMARFTLGWGILATLLTLSLRSMLSDSSFSHSASAWCTSQLELFREAYGPRGRPCTRQPSAQSSTNYSPALAHVSSGDLQPRCLQQPVRTEVVVLSMLRGTHTLFIAGSLWLLGGSVLVWLGTRILSSLVLSYWIQRQSGRLLLADGMPHKHSAAQALQRCGHVLIELVALPLFAFFLMPAVNGAVPFRGAALDLALALWHLFRRLGLPTVLIVLVVGLTNRGP